jgi:hypothetical protein
MPVIYSECNFGECTRTKIVLYTCACTCNFLLEEEVGENDSG